ncbi:hypothetical protein ACFL6Y_08465 [Elusimicrobiota bacterium]
MQTISRYVLVFSMLCAVLAANSAVCRSENKRKFHSSYKTGISLGAPTGFASTVIFRNNERFFGNLGFVSESFAIECGWEYKMPSVFKKKFKRTSLANYLGGGIHWNVSKKKFFGIGPSFVEEIILKKVPMTIALRAFPVLRVYPSTGFNFFGFLGLLYHF